MSIKGVVSFKDVRKSLKTHKSKKYGSRALSAIKSIAVHHSLTTTGSAEAYANYHVDTNGWPGIGYHYVIERDGTVKHCHDLTVLSYHVGNSNSQSVGICMTGNFSTSQEPTKEQRTSLKALINSLRAQLNLPVSAVKGHSEYPGYARKLCPCIDMNDLRKSLTSSSPSVSTPQAKPTTGSNPSTYVIQEGDTLWGISKNIDGVSVNDIIAWNPGIKASNLQIGQKLNMKKPANAPAPKPAPSSKKFPLPGGVLRQGDRGNGVKQLQAALDELYFLVGDSKGKGIDGIYGKATTRAVRNFQKMYAALTTDGIYGPATKAKIEEMLASRR